MFVGVLLVAGVSLYATKQMIAGKRKAALDEYKVQCESRFSSAGLLFGFPAGGT